jgi:short-chain fatty acids transporter
VPSIETKEKAKRSVSAQIIDRFTEWSLNWIPDSMVFVLILTLIVFFMALGLTSHGPWQLADDYAKGFWLLLSFAMQMALLMITGFVIADSKPVKAGISKLINIPKSPKTTLALFMAVVGIVSWMHWGVGLMLAIVMGREIAARKQGLGLHYPLIAAACYSVNTIMANGPSQAAPLMLATPGHFLEKMTGIIPISQTSFAHFQLLYVLIMFLTIPVVFMLIHPRKEDAKEIDPALAAEILTVEQEVESKVTRPAERWERSRFLQTLVALFILAWVGKFFMEKGIGKLDLNTLNYAFIGLSLLLHGSPRSFVNSVRKGVATTYGVIIQFPMYAGIFGMISSSGLAHVITNWFVSISSQGSYAWVIFLYTGIMDFFVPSAGSKFVIEAPYIIPAAQQLGVPVPQIIIAYCAGAQWVNNLQPFWALPVLAAFKLRFQDIMPFTFVIWLWVGIVSAAMYLLFPLGF